MKTSLSILLIVSGLFVLGACKHKDVDSVKPVPTDTLSTPAWQLNPDLILSNKILIAAHANSKRLVVAGIQGFFQMDAGDTSFVHPGLFGPTVSRFGTAGQAFAIGESTTTPVLSDHLYSSVRVDGQVVGLSIIGDSVASTQYYNPAASSLYIDYLLPQTNSNVLYNGLQLVNAPFGSFNEKTNILLLHSYSSTGACLIARKDSARYFAGYLGASSSGFPEIMLKAYQATLLTGLPIRASIAVDNHFVATAAGYVYLIYSDGSSKKVNNLTLIPSFYFYYRSHLYGADNQGGLIRSLDGGSTWQLVAKYSFSSTPYYTEIDGNLVAYGLSQLFWLDDGSETFTLHVTGSSNLKELNNAGLVGNQLTGVVQFGNKVYASTLSGLYQINRKDFFTSKTP